MDEEKEEIFEEEAPKGLDVAKLALRMKDHGIEDEIILAIFQSAKEDGDISEEELAKVLAIAKKDGNEDAEKADAEKAFGMKFLD